MRRQISLLLAVISTAIVVSFVIPLLLLVRTLAEDRGMATASQQANTIAVLVSSLHDDPRLDSVLQPSLDRSVTQTSVVLADGQVLGTPWPDVTTDPGYVQATGGQAFSIRDADGGRVYVPVLVDRGVVVVRSSVTNAQLAEGVPLAWAGIIGLGAVLSGIAVWVGARVGRGISRPLLAVAATAHRLREGDLAARAPLAGTEETIELGSALNGLADRIEELLGAERDNVRGLAHRLRTPVTALRLEAEQVSDPHIRAGLADSVAQLQTTIDDVVRQAQRPLREDLPGMCDATAVVRARVEYWRPLAEDQGRAVRASIAEQRIRVPVSALDLADVVDICLDNIFAHTPDEVGFLIELSAGADKATLLIADDGPGFPTEPDRPRPGTSGAGLELARRVVERAYGRFTLSPAGTVGAHVRVELPLR